MRTYVESSLQFAITAQLHDNNFVNAQAHKVERLIGLFFFVHYEDDCGAVRDWIVKPITWFGGVNFGSYGRLGRSGELTDRRYRFSASAGQAVLLRQSQVLTQGPVCCATTTITIR